MKVLSATHITKDITVGQFDKEVKNITSGDFLGFNDEEIPSEGNTHNKALHISLRCVNTLLSRVLVDIGSSLNVIRKTTLIKLSLYEISMKLITLIVKEFDGLRQAIIWEVDLPIRIGPTTFTFTFQVMDIHPAYICLQEWLPQHCIRRTNSSQMIK